MLDVRRLSLFLSLSVLMQPLLGEVAVVIDTPLPPPAWALMERELLQANSGLRALFGTSTSIARGYLLHTPRWGTLDGPDDAIETFFNWTLLHALGGSGFAARHITRRPRRATGCNTANCGPRRRSWPKTGRISTNSSPSPTGSTPAKACAPSFCGAFRPERRLYRARMKRFAGLYMNEDPEAPNYDPATQGHQEHLDRQQRPDDAQGHGVRLGGRSGARPVPSAAQSRRTRQDARPDDVLPEDAGALRRSISTASATTL